MWGELYGRKAGLWERWLICLRGGGGRVVGRWLCRAGMFDVGPGEVMWDGWACGAGV